MIHPEEPELETLQPGNSLVRAERSARRESPTRRSAAPQPGLLPAAAWLLGAGRPLLRGIERNPGPRLRWSRSERAPRVLLKSLLLQRHGGGGGREAGVSDTPSFLRCGP